MYYIALMLHFSALLWNLWIISILFLLEHHQILILVYGYSLIICYKWIVWNFFQGFNTTFRILYAVFRYFIFICSFHRIVVFCLSANQVFSRTYNKVLSMLILILIFLWDEHRFLFTTMVFCCWFSSLIVRSIWKWSKSISHTSILQKFDEIFLYIKKTSILISL